MRLLAVVCLALTGCGRYADFTLPTLSRDPAPAGFSFRAEPDPVLGRGDWDSKDVLNPSVVKRDGLYYNLYSGFDGQTWHTGLATSTDGVRWRKQGRVLSPDPRTWESDYIAANGSAVFWGREFLYWYQAGPKPLPQVGLARSRDGREWTRRAAPVLATGPRGSWDERGVADPYVIRQGGHFYMYYLGQDRARRQRLGVARSPDGVRWEKLRRNPILELGDAGAFDEEGLGEPAVFPWGGAYWMLYTGRDRHENRRLGLAVSADGVRWIKHRAVFAGQQPWNAKVICDPAVELAEGVIRVWFGGGDVASPDENLNGQIGIGTLTPSNATLTK